MAGIDNIGKNTYVTNQNYNGVKIDIHNPVVNAPQQGVTQPQTVPVKIYRYPEGSIPAEYYQQMIQNQKPVPPAALPEPKPAVELPKSVLENKTIPVPAPVYIDLKQDKKADTESAEEEIQEAAKTELPPVKENIQLETVQLNEGSNAQTKTAISDNIKLNNENQTSTERAIKDPDETIQRQISKVEIVPPGNTSPIVDYIKITEDLNSPNYDIQALQLKEIVDAGRSGDPEALRPYLVEPVFHGVIDIVNKDTTNLAGPTEAQNQIREQLIANYQAYKQQEQQNIPEDKMVFPYTISEQDKNYANTLSELELAERNKEYGIATLAMLSDAFLNRVKEESGTPVAITDVPGLSAIVNALKSDNHLIRLNALDALIFLQREEYARELTPIYQALVNTDPNETVRAGAQMALDNLKAKSASDEVKPNIAA